MDSHFFHFNKSLFRIFINRYQVKFHFPTHLKISKFRRALCSKCPQVRRWHSTLAIRAQTVELKSIENSAEIIDIVKIDNLTWTFQYYFETLYLRVQLPNGRIVSEIGDFLEDRLLDFYFCREHSEIHKLMVEVKLLWNCKNSNFQESTIGSSSLNCVKIWNCSLFLASSATYDWKLFGYLKNKSLNRFDIQILDKPWKKLYFEEYSVSVVPNTVKPLLEGPLVFELLHLKN